MKKVTKGIEPTRLETYRKDNPTAEWKQFTSKKARREEVQNRLKTDQGGLCAYCEIDLLENNDEEEADFRVEHFHPKSDDASTHNWHLDWNNLFGCCHGGSQRYVVNASQRFTSPENSCDVPKGDKNLDGIILNPLLIPAFPKLFSCDRATGRLSVDSDACQQEDLDVLIVQSTIEELNLDGERLRRFRRVTLGELNTQIRDMIAPGMTIGEAREKLAKAHLRKNMRGHWPKFFTSIRSYLGYEAEEQLKAIQYTG